MVCNNALPNLREVTPIMARLGALALATDQTRVFNLSVSEPGSQIFMPGDSLGYHQSTHEEPIDPVLGYQPRVAQYNVDTMELFAMLLKELDAVPEGDGTRAGPQPGLCLHRPELCQDPCGGRPADLRGRRRQRPHEVRLSMSRATAARYRASA